METIILGGGIAGLSLAYFLNGPSLILEKEKEIGGLCRSFSMNGIFYDVGPHILFSKNQEVLDLHISLTKMNKLRRSNKIFYQGKMIKYPFENDLAALEAQERDYCLQEFLHNPYEDYPAQNMLQFFIKIFGEGITKLYLQPYNEKIWKHDPVFLDTQMVERIPKPPKEDVIKSAQGIPTEGYLHQLYFYYPEQGGMQSLVQAYQEKLNEKSRILTSTRIEKIRKGESGIWEVYTNQGIFQSKRLINCMPLHEIFQLIDAPEEIKRTIRQLKYNSIYIVCVQVKKDMIGDNFSLNFPEKDIIFHRLSKLNFLGQNYSLVGGSTLLVEITYRPGSFLARLDEEEIKARVIADLVKLKLISQEDLLNISLQNFKYAYVIYDLAHRQNTAKIIRYLQERNIHCCGRFAEFEYLNTDQVVEHSQKLAKKINEKTI